MSTRPPISVRRPARITDPATGTPMPIVHSPIPNIDPDAAEAVAFSMRGRVTRPEETARGSAPGRSEPTSAEPGRPEGERRRVEAAHSMNAGDPPPPPVAREMDQPEGGASESVLGTDLVSVKLPLDVGRQLAAIADRRGSKRTLVAIEALSGPLRALADAHRAGGFPELPKVVSGTVRSSIAFALPPDLSADLDYVLRARRAVRAQVVTRLLAPAIRTLYEVEVTRRSR